jgi:uncharacterized protein YjdB
MQKLSRNTFEIFLYNSKKFLIIKKTNIMKKLLTIALAIVAFTGMSQVAEVNTSYPAGDYNYYLELPDGTTAYFGYNIQNTTKSSVNSNFAEIGNNSEDYTILSAFAGTNGIYAQAEHSNGYCILYIAYTDMYTANYSVKSVPGISNPVVVFFTTPNGVGIMTEDGSYFVDSGNGFVSKPGITTNGNPISDVINTTGNTARVIQGDACSFYRTITFDANGNIASNTLVSLGLTEAISGLNLNYDAEANILYGTGLVFIDGSPEAGAYMIDLNEPAGNQLRRIAETGAGNIPLMSRYQFGSLNGFIVMKNDLNWQATLADNTATGLVDAVLFVSLDGEYYEKFAQDVVNLYNTSNGGNFMFQKNNQDIIVVGGNNGNMYYLPEGATDFEAAYGMMSLDLTPPTNITSVTASAETDTMYIGDSIELISSYTPASAELFDFEWSTSNANIGVMSGNYLVGMGSGLVTVTLTDTETGISDSKEFVILAVPVFTESVEITALPDSLIVGASKYLQGLQNPSNVTNPGLTWSVESFGGQATITSSGKLTGVSEGEVKVTLTANDNGMETSEFIYIKKAEGPTGISNLTDLDGVSVYPNPARDYVIISNYPEQIMLFDQLGKQVGISFSEGDNQKIDLSHMSPGIYFLKTQNGESAKVIKN